MEKLYIDYIYIVELLEENVKNTVTLFYHFCAL
jgi:hypothetical protein